MSFEFFSRCSIGLLLCGLVLLVDTAVGRSSRPFEDNAGMREGGDAAGVTFSNRQAKGLDLPSYISAT